MRDSGTPLATPDGTTTSGAPAARTGPGPAHESASADRVDPVTATLRDPTHASRIQALRDAIDSFPGTLCQRCVGRFASRLDRTRDNPEIGATVAGILDIPTLAADDPACPWCEGLFRERAHLADLVCEAAKGYEFDTMVLGTKVHPDIQHLEANAEDHLDETAKEWYEPMKTELNRAVGAIALERLGARVDFDRADLLVMFDPYFDRTEVEAASLFLHGHYRKYDRTIPQTQWPCNRCKGKGCARCDHTGQQYGTSVQGLIQQRVIAAYDAEDAAFHGGGREDIDALMLGTGRPFVLELKRPRLRTPRLPVQDQDTQPDAQPERVPATLAELETHINAHALPRVEVTGLRASDKAEVVAVKEAALDKAYRAHVIAESAVARNDLDEAVATVTRAMLQQRTPARVAHRRADKVRERTVHEVAVVTFGGHQRAPFEAQAEAARKEAAPDAATPDVADAPAPHGKPDADDAEHVTHFTLDIVAEAGTYIKELVSGDDGRTQPSFAGLLDTPMKVVALDVVGMRPRKPAEA